MMGTILMGICLSAAIFGFLKSVRDYLKLKTEFLRHELILFQLKKRRKVMKNA